MCILHAVVSKKKSTSWDEVTSKSIPHLINCQIMLGCMKLSVENIQNSIERMWDCSKHFLGLVTITWNVRG